MGEWQVLMFFNSNHFLFFLPIVLLGYFILPKVARRYWIFLASLYFYAIFKVPFLVLLIFSFVWTYYMAMGISLSNTQVGRMFFLQLAIWGNLILLYVFKYMDFSIIASNYFLGYLPCDDKYIKPLGIVLPMGISFFCLQAISYAYDVYKKDIQPASSLFQFGLFLSFFPQLVAGPIIRAKDCLEQYKDSYDWNEADFNLGLRQLSLGFFKKTIIADQITLSVDPVFLNPSAYNGMSVWLSAILFSIQIYCDFSGYSDIAIGSARMMGYHFPKNFDRPFLSSTVTEFWTRWHISFSHWIRDHVYIPLGGSKVPGIRPYINMIITMFVSGLWHGADWNFILWGTGYGVYMAIERYALSFSKAKEFIKNSPRYSFAIYPFLVFAFSMIFFRAKPIESIPSSLDVAFYMIGRGLRNENGLWIQVPISELCLILVLIGYDVLEDKDPNFMDNLLKNKYTLYAVSSIILGLCFLIHSVTISQPFVYFQF